MTASSKAGLGFVVVGLVLGVVFGMTGRDDLETPLMVVVGSLCGVTVFTLSYRARLRKAKETAEQTATERKVEKR